MFCWKKIPHNKVPINRITPNNEKDDSEIRVRPSKMRKKIENPITITTLFAIGKRFTKIIEKVMIEKMAKRIK